jgi:ferritin-like metal-binding protein YciE
MANNVVSHHGLLVIALRDLHAGEQLWLERLPGLREAAGPALRHFIEGECERAVVQARELEEMATELDTDVAGSPNLWMSGILDDAKRDSETIGAGKLRDVALIGAFRKGKQAERVSYETAMGLSEYLFLTDILEVLTTIRSAEIAADADLKAQLSQLLTH